MRTPSITRLVLLVVFAAILILPGPAVSAPKRVSSSTRTLLDATVFNGQTGESIALLGVVRVRAKVAFADGTVAVETKLRERAFLAVVMTAENEEDPTVRRIRMLTDEAHDLRSQIAPLLARIRALRQHVEEVRATDSDPLRPGRQVDRLALAELTRELSQKEKQLQGLLNALSTVQRTIEALIARLNRRKQKFSEYSALGSFALPPSPCDSLLACERLVSFDVRRTDGTSATVQVRLTLRFSDRGRIEAAEADRACATTLSCSVDAGQCSCPSGSAFGDWPDEDSPPARPGTPEVQR